ncbi:3-hydroxybutyryl-CoA dehydrogenase [Brevundimonas subvibrioides]|uniref:3-hydroxyacyl-CoA dehydrogenase NAD-binding protein n=1 Tax=Brevundimonas subvibrioides (strain ATCC 15264 / DSM 4735 / LMG 14903 / NBRC 16000 / CB 81) TaxID=633149 RepID=D9QJ56_BRESC|nr:3-hydroxybutyryl-CoA dehydrogenase [Brevundimonas subvibrioides]ADK99580.1 3-hydroxyacyl-CoA dehydrogenase NAD-binding protein [Brevundimonas subvibrioides ATCC 15264]
MTSSIKTVAVIGAGQMGAGIAQAVALGGYRVSLFDVDATRLPVALGMIGASLARQVERGGLTQVQADAAMAAVGGVATLAEAGKADLVIEAAVEDETVKKAVFTDLVPHLGPDTLLASNTSSISITRLASATDRPDRFIGLHFMKPAPVMKLVEIIRGIATSAATYDTAVAFAESLGKTTTNAEDFPAFIVNRILVPMINEAIYVLYEGVGNVASIDKALKLGANHPMGPLALADFMGLDVVLAIMNVLYEGLADSKYRPCPLLVKYVEAGWLGRKSGRGFYDYSGDVPVPTR